MLDSLNVDEINLKMFVGCVTDALLLVGQPVVEGWRAKAGSAGRVAELRKGVVAVCGEVSEAEGARAVGSFKARSCSALSVRPRVSLASLLGLRGGGEGGWLASLGSLAARSCSLRAVAHVRSRC
eukprot:SAG11_NODE_4296_length_1965_cov_16.844051_1_plen_125_part_00